MHKVDKSFWKRYLEIFIDKDGYTIYDIEDCVSIGFSNNKKGAISLMENWFISKINHLDSQIYNILSIPGTEYDVETTTELFLFGHDVRYTAHNPKRYELLSITQPDRLSWPDSLKYAEGFDREHDAYHSLLETAMDYIRQCYVNAYWEVRRIKCLT